MTEMAEGMASMPSEPAVPTRRWLVVDATPSLQAWVDDLCDRLLDTDEEAGDSAVPDGTVVVTVAALWRAVETSFTIDGKPRSIIEHGWPKLPDPLDTNPGDWYSQLQKLVCRLLSRC